ncbi:hypothetical protein [Streptomyces sp. NY05-11A]|uniref:hypothetical protein n=1 Tax=Streptomyces soliscabiei TaxID=588897 RepID=UPI0039F7333F
MRTRTVGELAKVDAELAREVAHGIGVPDLPGTEPEYKLTSPALSLESESLRGDGSIRTRRIAVLVTDGVDPEQVTFGARGAGRRRRDREGASGDGW